jgi:hypothetical protein
MKKHFLIVGTCILALGMAAFAGDIWKDKPYEQWDDKDVAKVLNDSPWAQKLVMATAGGMRGGEGGEGGFSRPGQDSSASTAGANGDGVGSYGSSNGGRQVTGSELPGYPRSDGSSNVEGRGGTGGQTEYLARWVSSRTLREAFARSSELQGKPNEQLVKAISTPPEFYSVIIISRDLRAFQAEGADGLKQEIYLETKKSHEKLTPVKVTLGTDPGGKRVIYVLSDFARTTDKGAPELGADEKEVDFVATAGKLKLKFHFELSKMADKQGTDL